MRAHKGVSLGNVASVVFREDDLSVRRASDLPKMLLNIVGSTGLVIKRFGAGLRREPFLVMDSWKVNHPWRSILGRLDPHSRQPLWLLSCEDRFAFFHDPEITNHCREKQFQSSVDRVVKRFVRECEQVQLGEHQSLVFDLESKDRKFSTLGPPNKEHLVPKF